MQRELCVNFALQIAHCGATGLTLGGKYHRFTALSFTALRQTLIYAYSFT